jgi:hypothetical protein
MKDIGLQFEMDGRAFSEKGSLIISDFSANIDFPLSILYHLAIDGNGFVYIYRLVILQSHLFGDKGVFIDKGKGGPTHRLIQKETVKTPMHDAAPTCPVLRWCELGA